MEDFIIQRIGTILILWSIAIIIVPLGIGYVAIKFNQIKRQQLEGVTKVTLTLRLLLAWNFLWLMLVMLVFLITARVILTFSFLALTALILIRVNSHYIKHFLPDDFTLKILKLKKNYLESALSIFTILAVFATILNGTRLVNFAHIILLVIVVCDLSVFPLFATVKYYIDVFQYELDARNESNHLGFSTAQRKEIQDLLAEQTATLTDLIKNPSASHDIEIKVTDKTRNKLFSIASIKNFFKRN